jgi:tetratricopeptide (TPR) repeat protein
MMGRQGRAWYALGAACLVLKLAGPSEARADAPPPAAESAEQLAERAYRLHADGKYAEAIAMYLRAYEASSAAPTLFNIATIYDHKLHEPELASSYYRRYLRAPDAEPDLVEKATARLTELKRSMSDASAAPPPAAVAPVDTQSPASATAPSPSTTPSTATATTTTTTPATTPATATATATATTPASSSSRRTAGIVVAAVGAGGIGASLVLGWLASSKNSDANDLCSGQACTSDRGVSLAHDAGTFATGATIAFVGGAALVGVGVALVLTAPHAGSPASPSVALAPEAAPSGATLSLRGRF